MPNYRKQIKELNEEVNNLKQLLNTVLAILTHNIGGLANIWISPSIMADVVKYLKSDILTFPLSESNKLSRAVEVIKLNAQTNQKDKVDEQNLINAIEAFKTALNTLQNYLEIAETGIFVCLIRDQRLKYKKEIKIDEFNKQFQEFCRLFDPKEVKTTEKHEEIISQLIEADNASKTYVELGRLIQESNYALANITSNIKRKYSEVTNDNSQTTTTTQDSHHRVKEGVFNVFIGEFRKLLQAIHDLPPSFTSIEPNKLIQLTSGHVPSDKETKIETEIQQLIHRIFNKPSSIEGESTVENYVLNTDTTLKTLLNENRMTYLKILELEKKVDQSLSHQSMSYLGFKQHLPDKLIALLPFVKRVLEDEQVKKEIKEYCDLNIFKNETSYSTLSAEDFKNQAEKNPQVNTTGIPFQSPETLSNTRIELNRT